MPRKRYTPEEIVAKLRQVEVLTSQGASIAEAPSRLGSPSRAIIAGAKNSAV